MPAQKINYSQLDVGYIGKFAIVSCNQESWEGIIQFADSHSGAAFYLLQENNKKIPLVDDNCRIEILE